MVERAVEKYLQVGFFLTGEFLPRVSRNWDQESTNGFLHRVPDGR